MAYTYKYPRPAVTVDMLVFRKKENKWQLLLIQRKHDPFAGKWALPGGFMDMDETLEAAAARELKEETGLAGVPLEQLKAYSALNRDPRHRTVSVAFTGILKTDAPVQAGDDAGRVAWFPVDNLPGLAFDHDRIIADGLLKISEINR